MHGGPEGPPFVLYGNRSGPASRRARRTAGFGGIIAAMAHAMLRPIFAVAVVLAIAAAAPRARQVPAPARTLRRSRRDDSDA